MLLLLDEEGRTTRGQWLASTPAAPDTPPGGTADDRVTALSVAHDGHRSTGYISMDLAQEADGGWSRTLEHSRLGSVTSYTYLRSGYDHGSTPATLPWVELGLPTPYFPNNHGAPGAVMWHTPQGPREDDGPRFARTLARRRSLTSLAPGHPVVPLICYAAARPGIGGVLGGDVSGPLPFVPDPLAVVATGQHMANETGRTVFATVLANSVGPARYNDPETYINLVTDARGRAHRWVMFRPEPPVKRSTVGPARPDCTRARTPPRTPYGSGPCGWCGHCARSSAPRSTRTRSTRRCCAAWARST